MTVTVDYVAETREAYNVIAETRTGNDDNVVMAGAHLDSVQDGAGINDNGSGSAALLETAIQMAKVKPTNTVRFAWWGAEESGLLGSEHYVAELSRGGDRRHRASTSTSTWSASPNYMFGIYDGDNSGGTAAPGFIPPGSAEIEDVFESFYASRGEPFVRTAEFSGRSDYGPFIAVGIPAGGLFTGAEDVEDRGGGRAVRRRRRRGLRPVLPRVLRQPHGRRAGRGALRRSSSEDYELVGNINVHALDVNADAIATAVLTFAYDSSSVNGVAGKPGRSLGLYKPGATS